MAKARKRRKVRKSKGRKGTGKGTRNGQPTRTGSTRPKKK